MRRMPRTLAAAGLGLLAALGLGQAAQSNPWPRGAGQGFAMLSLSTLQAPGAPSGAQASLLVDRGIGARAGVSFKLEGAGAGQPGRAVLELRRHGERAGGQPHAMALALTQTGGAPGLRAGLHAGRGMASGWLRGSIEAEARRGTAPVWTLDAQAGWKLRRAKLIMGVSAHHTGGRSTFSWLPQVVTPLGPGRHLALEYSLKTGASRGQGLSLSLWQKF